jgi:hypothetical protein
MMKANTAPSHPAARGRQVSLVVWGMDLSSSFWFGRAECDQVEGRCCIIQHPLALFTHVPLFRFEMLRSKRTTPGRAAKRAQENCQKKDAHPGDCW